MDCGVGVTVPGRTLAPLSALASGCEAMASEMAGRSKDASTTFTHAMLRDQARGRYRVMLAPTAKERHYATQQAHRAGKDGALSRSHGTYVEIAWQFSTFPTIFSVRKEALGEQGSTTRPLSPNWESVYADRGVQPTTCAINHGVPLEIARSMRRNLHTEPGCES